MGCINGNGSHSGLKQRGYLDLGPIYILFFFDPIMVGVYCHRNSNIQLVAECIDLPGNIPVIDCTIGIGTSLRPGDFYDNGGICSLSGLKSASNHKIVSTVGSHGDGFTLG